MTRFRLTRTPCKFFSDDRNCQTLSASLRLTIARLPRCIVILPRQCLAQENLHISAARRCESIALRRQRYFVARPDDDNFRFARHPSKADAKRGDHFLQADLNEAAGAADASRAMLRASCPSVTHRIRVLAHAHFLSTAKPIAYRWAKRLNSHSH